MVKVSSPRALVAVFVTSSLVLVGCGVSTSSEVVAPATQTATGDSAQTPSPEATEPSATATPNNYVAEPPAKVKVPKKIKGGPPVISRIDTKRKVVFLTIDDGYHTDPRTAKVLADYGVPATQFLTDNAVNGDRYRYYRKISERDGQVIQNHTISHPDLKTLGYEAQKAQICQTNQKFKQAFGQRPYMLRPPYGNYNESVRKAANACGIDYIVNWSTTMPKDKIRYQVGNKLRPGDIILTHWSESFHKWLRGLIKEVHRQGFKFGALQDYLPKK